MRSFFSTLATVNGNRVYLAGGELNGDNGGACGPSAIAFAESFRVNFAIISIHSPFFYTFGIVTMEAVRSRGTGASIATVAWRAQQPL